MARVRQSQRLARLFWRFLTEWLILRDVVGLEATEALCDCGREHRYYPAEWLVPLVENKWVPRGERRADRATAQSLASLLRDSDRSYHSLTDNPMTVRLLEAIGVTRFDLMRELASEDDDTRKAVDGAFMDMLVASGGDVGRLFDACQYLKKLDIDPELPQIVEERLNRIRRVRENRHLGDQVEDLVKRSLEDKGFVVRRTGIGSDFEIEHDSAEVDDLATLELTRSERTWLVEVKSTRDRAVRMTATQARTAEAHRDGFLLCVVPITNEVLITDEIPESGLRIIRDSMRFVTDIGRACGSSVLSTQRVSRIEGRHYGLGSARGAVGSRIRCRTSSGNRVRMARWGDSSCGTRRAARVDGAENLIDPIFSKRSGPSRELSH